MSTKQAVITGRHAAGRGRLGTYITGYVLSVLLTIIPFSLVMADLVNGWALTATLIVFALLQLLVQLQFFIHLGHESGTPWNKVVFLFMVLILFIVVGGSLWIMHNLDYHHGSSAPKDGSDTPYEMDDYPHYDRNMTPEQTNDFIIQDEGFKQ